MLSFLIRLRSLEIPDYLYGVLAVCSRCHHDETKMTPGDWMSLKFRTNRRPVSFFVEPWWPSLLGLHVLKGEPSPAALSQLSPKTYHKVVWFTAHCWCDRTSFRSYCCRFLSCGHLDRDDEMDPMTWRKISWTCTGAGGATRTRALNFR